MSKTKRSFAARLDRLAQVAVKVGLRPAVGQQVILTAPVEALPLVRLITEHAYREGASLVTTLLDDGQCAVARYKYGHDSAFDVAPDWLFAGMEHGFKNNAARMAISGENPGLLSGQDPARISRAAKARGLAYKPVSELITSSAINWNISSCATLPWAKMMFPELSDKRALNKLWDAIFKASRADADDPVAAWTEHNNTLLARRKILNDKRYSALHFRGPGTDLVVGLADDHRWAGGLSEAANGITFNPNIPTEEVFTTPHYKRVDGYVSSTKPLSLQGNVLEGIRVRFEGGRIVDARADNGQAVLEKLIQTDEGASYLGEVALVPHSSPISASGLLFYNTLYDENAACHIAIGQSYSKCIADGRTMTREELAAKGGNHSNVHVDWMIGSGQVDIDGITADGAAEPVMRKGEWA